MDGFHFDALTCSLARSRRAVICSAVGFGALTWPGLGDARKKKRKHKKRKHKKVTFNDFGCVNVGDVCKTSEHCCSGICSGKKDKKRCQAHDQSTCLAGQTDGYCGGEMAVEVGCVTSTDESGVCLTTTGNGPYCAVFGQCFPCATDADCVPFCGQEAACIVCTENCAALGGTMCAKPSSGSCQFPYYSLPALHSR